MRTKLQDKQWEEASNTYVGKYLSPELLKAGISDVEKADNMMSFVETLKGSGFSIVQLQFFYKIVMESSPYNPINKKRI